MNPLERAIDLLGAQYNQLWEAQQIATALLSSNPEDGDTWLTFAASFHRRSPEKARAISLAQQFGTSPAVGVAVAFMLLRRIQAVCEQARMGTNFNSENYIVKYYDCVSTVYMSFPDIQDDLSLAYDLIPKTEDDNYILKRAFEAAWEMCGSGRNAKPAQVRRLEELTERARMEHTGLRIEIPATLLARIRDNEKEIDIEDWSMSWTWRALGVSVVISLVAIDGPWWLKFICASVIHLCGLWGLLFCGWVVSGLQSRFISTVPPVGYVLVTIVGHYIRSHPISESPLY